MEFTGAYQIPASRERVWAALNDPEILRQCIDGCEAMARQSETEYVATVATKLGPMRVRFAGKVSLSELDPPNGYLITGEGQGGVAGFAKGSARVSLVPDGDGTLLSYAAKGSVGGKMAQLGARLIDATAHKLAEDFFSKFSSLVAAQPAAETVLQPAAPAAPDGPSGQGPAGQEPEAVAARKGLPTAVWVVGLIVLIGAILALFLA